jgi:hypothetical protein
MDCLLVCGEVMEMALSMAMQDFWYVPCPFVFFLLFCEMWMLLANYLEL